MRVEANNVTMKWNSTIANCNSMFFVLNNIIIFELTKFDAAIFEDMIRMFYECKSLISIKISEFNTPALTNISVMLYGCSEM